MNADRWRRVTELFHAALERPPEERDAFLDVACAGDPALLADVRALLASHARASDAKLMENPAVANDPDLITEATKTPERSLEGQVIADTYRVLREIARGGMGIVYLAEHIKLGGRRTALKALPESFAKDNDRRERLRREASVAANLKHSAVATVYDLVEGKDGALFIASEYIDGNSLRDEIRRGPLEPHDLMATARAIASALAAAHAMGIVHRDLKPENVMRTPDRAIKVLDFGLARLLADDPEGPTNVRLTVEGAIVGTPGYMAPEQLEGRPVDARADVYAFGVLLHELATGRMPGSGGVTPRARSSAEPPLPPHLESIIRGCLAPNPADRFQSGADILASLETTAPASQAPDAAAPRTPVWWWQFHQLAIAALHASLLVGVWFARGWLDPPWRSIAFYIAIIAAVSGVTMRLNLWFASRVHPDMLAAQRATLMRTLVLADAAFAFILCALGAAGAGAHDELAAVLVGGAIVSLLSLLVIEPSTARAAFDRPRGRQSKPRRTPPRRPSR